MANATQTKAALGNIVGREIARAENSGDAAEANRERSVQYYLGQLPGADPVPGRSSSVSTDVADMINAVMAIMVPMLSTDCVAEFEPDAEDDEENAKAESYIVNSLVIEDNRGFVEIQEAVKDALMMRNGCMKVTVDDKPETQTQSLSDLDERQREIVLTNVKAEGLEAELKDDQIVITTPRRRFVVGSVPIENMCWQAGYSGDIQDIRFIAEGIEYTRSELVQMGISRTVVDELKALGTEAGQMVKSARDRGSVNRAAETKDQDLISCHEAYILTDLDGDGVSERYQVLVANNDDCLTYERTDLIPYALGSPFINPHRIEGESLTDHMVGSQDVKTTLLRQLLNNTAAVNNGRYVYDPSRVSEEDILNPTPGGGIRSRDPSAVQPLIVPDVSMGILASLNYQDKQRTERGGAALEMMQADAQIVGETAHGVERQYASREAMVNLMAVNLSETLLRSVYLLAHEFMRRFADRPYGTRVAGQWVQSDPRQWKPRTRINIKTGRTPGIRGALLNVLQLNAQFQAQAMAGGGAGVLVGPDQVYRNMMEWLNMAGVSNPERLWIDPASPPAQAVLQGQQQTAQQQSQMQQQLLQLEVQLKQTKEETDRLKVQYDYELGQVKNQIEYYKAQMEPQKLEAELAGRGMTELQKEKMSNETQIAIARIGRAANGAAGAGGNGGQS